MKNVQIFTFFLLFVMAQSAAGMIRTSRQLQEAEEIVTKGVRNNFISTLSRLAQSTFVAGTNITRASAVLIRGIVREQFNLRMVFANLPKLFLLDGPLQFIETLRLIRSNQIKPMPNDMNEAIDNVITFTESLRKSAIPAQLAPLVEFFPNIFTGVEKFAQDVMYNVFAWVGPVPEAGVLDSNYEKQSLRVIPSSTTSKSKKVATNVDTRSPEE